MTFGEVVITLLCGGFGSLAVRFAANVMARRRKQRRAYVEYQRPRALGGRVIETGERTGVHATGTTTVGQIQARIAHE